MYFRLHYVEETRDLIQQTWELALRLVNSEVRDELQDTVDEMIDVQTMQRWNKEWRDHPAAPKCPTINNDRFN